MKIAIVGYGKMGKMVEQAARANKHSIAAIVDPYAADAPLEIPFSRHITEAALDSVDAAIEFSTPAKAVSNIIYLAKKKIPTVTGTTGWYDQMAEVIKAVENVGSSLLWASNFSIGVNLFYRIAWHASELLNKFPGYDVGGFESHHNKKLDSPSGTAKILAEGVLSRIDRKNKIVWDTINRRPEKDELHFPSLRIGNVPGQHSLFFDSSADTIELTHTARSREGLALGAVQAAEWLAAGRRGVFTIDDMLKDILNI
jgi:4-hydroxy-tetrahydrodipicolinate reductase